MNSVKLNNFSLEILANLGTLFGSYSTPFEPVEKIIYKSGNYFSLPHNTTYKIRLGNGNNVKADAHVYVDGDKIGVWRINPHSKITVERPSNIARKFVVLKEGTRRAIDAGIESGLEDNGIIKVVFKPAKFKLRRYYRNIPYFGLGDEERYLNFASNINSKPQCLMDYSDTVTPSNLRNASCSMSNMGYSESVSLNLTSAATALGEHSNQEFKAVESLDDIDHDMITPIYARLVVDNDKGIYKNNLISIKHALNRSNIKPERLELRHPVRPHSCAVDSKFSLSKKFWFDNF